MKLQNQILTTALLLLAGGSAVLAQGRQEILAKRTTLAITYPEGKSSTVDMAGTGLHSIVTGRAEAKRSGGRTRIKLLVNDLPHPQGVGAFYTTYVVWAITPDGLADNLGELPMPDGDKREIEVTTPHQTFGVIVTAEPYGLVKYPSPVIVAENILRKDTKGNFTASNIEYRGDTGALFTVSAIDSAALPPDYRTPTSVLGARRAVEIARRAEAQHFAEPELRQAEIRLAALEQIWSANRGREEKFSGEAREVMRLAEAARALAVDRAEQARLTAERQAASQAIGQAQSEASRARGEAERAKQQADDYRAALGRSESELARARQNAEQTQTEAERSKAREEVARLEAERARLESEQAKRDRDAAMQRLMVSLSEILDTRREARGLIVSLSDVLFDFNKATLKPGAKEKLSKLTGVLLAYPGTYRMEIEGHTDSVGSDDYNQKLSEARAASVNAYLREAGLPGDRITAVRGFGKSRPVTTNDTPEGRQMNRRVEIVIADTEPPTAASNR